MIAEQKPIRRELAAANARFDDGVSLHAGVHVHFHVNFYGAGEAIHDGQCAPANPSGLQDRSCFREEAWRHAMREGAREFSGPNALLRSDVLCAGDGRPSRASWDRRNDVIVSDCAALDVTFRAPRAIGKTFPFV